MGFLGGEGVGVGGCKGAQLGEEVAEGGFVLG